MTTRRQALHSNEPLASGFLLSPILLAQSEPARARSVARGPVKFVNLSDINKVTLPLVSEAGDAVDMPDIPSAVTLIMRRCHRRDYASPRRIGRRI